MGLAPKHIERLNAAKAHLARDPASVRRRLETMEQLLERAFVVPGINRQVGLDSIVGVVPIVGDLFSAAMGAWMIWEARNLGMSKFQMARMAANIGVDTTLGAVPLAGDVFDFFYRSHSKNLRIVQKHLDKHHPAGAVVEGAAVRPASDA